MNQCEKFVMRRILKKEVRQGFDHNKRIEELYAMIREAAEAEFKEDNAATLNEFLFKCFVETLK